MHIAYKSGTPKLAPYGGLARERIGGHGCSKFEQLQLARFSLSGGGIAVPEAQRTPNRGDVGIAGAGLEAEGPASVAAVGSMAMWRSVIGQPP